MGRRSEVLIGAKILEARNDFIEMRPSLSSSALTNPGKPTLGPAGFKSLVGRLGGPRSVDEDRPVTIEVLEGRAVRGPVRIARDDILKACTDHA